MKAVNDPAPRTTEGTTVDAPLTAARPAARCEMSALLSHKLAILAELSVTAAAFDAARRSLANERASRPCAGWALARGSPPMGATTSSELWTPAATMSVSIAARPRLVRQRGECPLNPTNGRTPAPDNAGLRTPHPKPACSWIGSAVMPAWSMSWPDATRRISPGVLGCEVSDNTRGRP